MAKIQASWQAVLIAVFVLSSLAYCFTTEEIEIFQLQKEITKRYGVDFYRFLELPRLKDSTPKEIAKNFRKLSKKYHPDKNKKYKKRFERLNLVSKILSDSSQRKTYDYYFKNGFPDYDFSKGGFFFKRTQPKVWFILAFLYIACGLIHLVLLKLQNNSNKTRIKRFLRDVRQQDDTNGLGEKHLVLKRSEEDIGKEIIVRFGDVFVVQSDGIEAQVSLNDIKDPGLQDCMLVLLPLWLWKKTLGRLIIKSPVILDSDISSKTSKLSKKNTKINNGGDVMELPNGTVIHSRKKKIK